MKRELTIVIPTYNERKNIEPLIQLLNKAFKGHSWEGLFVDDDSSDGTAQLIKEIGQRDDRIHCLHPPDFRIEAPKLFLSMDNIE